MFRVRTRMLCEYIDIAICTACLLDGLNQKIHKPPKSVKLFPALDWLS